MVGKDGTILYHWREIRQLQASSLRCITKLRFDPSNYHLVGIWAKQMWSLEADGGVLLIGGIKVEAPQSLLGILWQFRSGYIKADSVLVEINRSKKEDWSLRKKKKIGFYKKIFILPLLYNIDLVFTVQKSDSAVPIQISSLILWIYFSCRSSQNTE